MRLRNVPGSREALAESPYIVRDLLTRRGRWSETVFGNSRPIHLELGTGKGKFLYALAQQHPEINYLGAELYSSVLIRAVDRLTEEPLPNLRFLCLDAFDLPAYMGPGEVQKIYLNFSDPWPKERHAKRRLTSERFLHSYEKYLAPDGLLEFKTDNTDLFDFSLESVPAAGWELVAFTRDLHADPVLSAGNVMTEYEEKFSSRGVKICKLIARQGQKKGASMANIITTETFEALALKAEKPVLVDFYADWCGPCKMVAPVVEELAGKYAGQIEVYKLNVDDSPEIAQRYGIMSIPSLLFFKGGEVVKKQVGFVPGPVLEGILKEVL
ncbi:MAG: tRNA (guanosine(46)-N7)-methyltransferase TrmB [Lachnospiraceae bacterium]|nr:tRNA (guanosine(46)-N7)-methyltransferase TrmB [Lachnospiraceae bacterium]